MGDMSTQSKRCLGDGGCGSVQVWLSQRRQGLGSRVAGWDDHHTRMTIQVTSTFHVRVYTLSTSRVNSQRHGLRKMEKSLH